MKILMVDKYFFIKGGAERYCFDLTKILTAHGHQVIPFSMLHQNNFPTPFEKYFVDNINYDFTSTTQHMFRYFRSFCRMIYSLQAKKRLENLISQEKPDVAHLHMIEHQLSPSILHVLKKYDIPALQTVHQYKLVCPNYRLYNMSKHQICEKCLSGNYYYPIFEKCHMNSRLAGMLLSFEMYLHKLMRIYEQNIDIFHVPSKFIGQKLLNRKIPAERIQHLFYTIELEKYSPNFESDNYFVYFGRLAEEKGILTLLRAMKSLNLQRCKLIIIGEGPQRQELETFVKQNQLSQVIFIGKKEAEELKSILLRSKFMVVPSEWYDNSPLVIYESFALGKPVIGSDLGGIPELVEHKKTGLLFKAGNSEELSENIDFLLSNPALIKEYGMTARKKAEKEFDTEFHYQEMLKKYQQIQHYN